jgi:hypothetical protein
MRVLRLQFRRHPLFVFTYKVQAGEASQHTGLVSSPRSRERQEFPLARSGPYLGELVCAERSAALVLQELGGWETERMVRRYAHFAASYLAVYADQLEILGTNEQSNRPAGGRLPNKHATTT